MSKKEESMNMSFEEAVKELEGIVEALESNDLTLDQSLEVFQRGVLLSAYCSKKLDDAEGKITMLMKETDRFKEKPFMLKEEA